MVVILILLLLFFFVPFPDTLRHTLFPAVGVLALVLLVLGIVLIVAAARSGLGKKHKVFLILMGAAGAGALVFSVLHNVFYALEILLGHLH